MKFLIFIKQVPLSSEIKFDPDTKTLIREGVKCEINAYDRRAITEAIRYRNENGGEVIVATMGPPQAADALREALIMGADSCVLISDPQLAGSDTLATARVLAKAAVQIGYDLIFCGQHSTDSETGQVPAELAELLNIPLATAVKKIEYLPDRLIQATSETEEGSLIQEIPLPAVLTAAERLIRPLKTKNADLSVAPDEKIHRMNVRDLGLNAQEVGVKGSPTWVADVVDRTTSRSPQLWDGTDVRAVAAKLLEVLRERKEIKSTLPVVPESQVSPTSNNAFWCWIEFLEGKIQPVSLEILSTAATLAREKGSSVCAILNGALNDEIAGILASFGADQICHISGELHPDAVVSLFTERIQKDKPFAVFFPATSYGRMVAPRIAARLGLGLTGDCIRLSFSEDGRLAQWKPAFGGNIVAPIYSRTDPQMATIRAGALDPMQPRKHKAAEVVPWLAPDVSPQSRIIAREIDPGVEASRLDHSRVVIGIGAGLGEQNVSAAKRLATLLDGSIAATRKVVDSGWVQRQFQVGLTGKFIAPEIYLGFGVSGRYNHMIGVQRSGLIVGVNQDPSAEIFQVCDIGVQGDCVAIMNEMIGLLD